MLYQPPLPPRYVQLSPDQLRAAIADRKRQLGSRLVILGHHYQEDDVIAFADFTGDSLKLSQAAAAQKDAEFVVFCGVHFMAETADMLTDDHVQVILPDLSAGCSMADMAAIEQLEVAWEELAGATAERIVPITYVNSSAAVKAFCGEHDGACCTSSNASRILRWALDHGDKVLFLPDQHLGRNTALAMGWPHESMVVYDPNQPLGGLGPEQVQAAKFILWKGHCSVHGLFTEEDCDRIRALGDDWKILVHPECRFEVVQLADEVGSTEQIVRTVTAAEPGSQWAVGTEIHLVNRLSRQFTDRRVMSLDPSVCVCTTMFRITPQHLLWTLENLAAGRVVNRIAVDDRTRHWARVALERMLSLR